jgi:hypothetical protein
MKKSDREIMEILEAFDVTGCAHSAAALAGVDPKTVRRYVDARDAGRPVDAPVTRAKLIDAFMGKVEELVETSEGKVRADVVHERLELMGFTGDERTTRRAVAVVKVRIGRGSPSRGCGCSSTGATARSCQARMVRLGARCCSARGWRGRGSGW